MIHCYTLCGYNIVLDVASGSIHKVDELAYDVICEYEHVRDVLKSVDHISSDKDIQNELIEKVLLKHSGVSGDDIVDVINDIEMLISRGKLFSSDSFTESKLSSHTPVKALCLNVSHVCNMSCAYCFAGFGSGGSGDDCNAGAFSSDKRADKDLMSLETGKRAIDFLIEQSGNRKNLDVDFFGGEPLINWEVVKGIVRYAREIERKSDKKLRFTLTTNGLLIDDDVINFTNNQMHNVVLSLDGRPETHDAMRKLPDGSGSYSAVVDNIKRLVDARRAKGYYIRGTFTRNNLDFVNDILHIADLGFKEISLEPVVGQGKELTGEPSPCQLLSKGDLPEIFAQYELLAVEMLRRERIGYGFNFYHYNLDLTGGPCVYKRIAGCGVGTEYLAVTPSGELYPCHQFIGESVFLMGDVWKGVTSKSLHSKFAVCSIHSRQECQDCWARYYCSGGCAANSYFASGSINGIYKPGCEIFKKRIECAIMMKAAAL